ncbi:LamG-like jellyroll fold domain-containing protein [Rubritalea tangerina]
MAALLCLLSSQSEAQISSSGLLAYFPFDGTADDNSSSLGGSTSTNNGTWTGNANFQTGIFGQAAIIGNGAGSNYLVTSSNEYLFNDQSFTILYWVNLKANIPSDPGIITSGGKNWSSSGGYQGWVSAVAGDDIKANISSGSGRNDTSWVELNNDSDYQQSSFSWTLVALVVDQNNNTLTNYVLDPEVTTIGDDGSAPTSSGLPSGNLVGSNNSIVIGQDGDLSGYSLPATGIDDLSIWSRPLSQEEIQAIYSAGRQGSPLSATLSQNILTTTLDKDAGTATLSWNSYDLTGISAPTIKVSRNGSTIATLTATDTSYVDSPPAPANSSLNYQYKIELYDADSPVANTASISNLTWSPSGTAFDLVAQYSFENGFNDTAGAASRHNGSGANNPTISGNGVAGHQVTFIDQLKQAVIVPDHNDLDFGANTDFTLSLWVKRDGSITTSIPNAGSSDGTIICKQNWTNGSNPGWGLYATGDGGLKWNLAGSSRKQGTIISGSQIADERWHHILVSNSRSGNAECYVNGELATSFSIAGAGSVDNAMDLAMGTDGNGNYAWRGSIDEVTIWRRALNSEDVKEVYHSSQKGIAMSQSSILDSDADKMDDDWEITHFGNTSQSGDDDFDGDGLTNFHEYAAGTNPNSANTAAPSRVTFEEFEGQLYPVLHYVRPSLINNIQYLPESSADLKLWNSDSNKFIPFVSPTDLGGGKKEFHLRYFQTKSAVAAGKIMMRVRMEPHYQGAISESIQPTVELRNGQAVISWTTTEPTVTILDYGLQGSTTSRYEDYTLSTYHEVVITDLTPDAAFTYTVIQDNNGVLTRSKTFTTESLWDYSPPPVVDQAGFDSGNGWTQQAEAILSTPGVLDRGYCLDYLCGDGRLAYELARQSQLVVIGVEDTQAEVDAARAFLCERGIYGSRVTVVLADDLANLPFPEDFFNLIVSQSQVASQSPAAALVSNTEKHSIPGRGIVAALDSGSFQSHLRATLPGTGSWTMSYGNPANTGASQEEFSGKTRIDDFELRWLGSPGPELAWDRQVAEQPPLAANGRFYCQGKGRILALDSHNGSILWTRELDDAQRFNMLRDAGNLTADDDAVWLSLRKEAWKMDGDTGKLTTFPLVNGPRNDVEYHWNYICRTGNHLLGSASVPEAFYKNHWGSQYWYTHNGGAAAQQVMSDNLFSLDKDTGSQNWEYHDGLILSVSITVGNGRVYFLETRNASALSAQTRRLSPSTWKQDLYLVCLNLSTGSKAWETPLTISGGDFTTFLMCDESTDSLVITSGNGSTNFLYGFNAATGAATWNQSAPCYKTDHGGKSQHAVITNSEVLMTPNVFDSATGTLKRSDIPKNNGGGCNTYWGSKNLLFYRTGYSGKGLSMWPIQGGQTTGIDHVRGACWLNWAPADGMFLIQEKSAGCSCGAWVHISHGWGPKK